MDERRQYSRVKKHFILTYAEKDNPTIKHEITQLKNISLGGMCFITTKSFPESAELSVELKTPYIADTTHLEGFVCKSHEKVVGLIYETRIKFEPLSPDAETIIKRLINSGLSKEN